MSEEEKPKNFAELQTQMFRDYLARKNIDLKCEVCGSGNFGFVGRTENAQLAPAIYYQRPGIATPFNAAGVEAAMATCLNCGNIKLFNRHLIDSFMSGKNG